MKFILSTNSIIQHQHKSTALSPQSKNHAPTSTIYVHIDPDTIRPQLHSTIQSTTGSTIDDRHTPPMKVRPTQAHN